MRRLIVPAFISLDGVVQAPGGPEEDTSGGFVHGGWVWPFADDTDEAMGGVFSQREVQTEFATDAARPPVERRACG